MWLPVKRRKTFNSNAFNFSRKNLSLHVGCATSRLWFFVQNELKNMFSCRFYFVGEVCCFQFTCMTRSQCMRVCVLWAVCAREVHQWQRTRSAAHMRPIFRRLVNSRSGKYGRSEVTYAINGTLPIAYLSFWILIDWYVISYVNYSWTVTCNAARMYSFFMLRFSLQAACQNGRQISRCK